MATNIPKPARRLRTASACLLAAGALMVFVDASARGGGGRGMGGGGGRMASPSISGANRMATRPSPGTRPSTRPSTGNRPSTGAIEAGNRPANGNRPGNGDIGNVNRPENRPGNGNGINTGDINIDRGDINIDVDGGYGNGWGYGGYYHPIAAGVAIGAVAVTTAAIVGSYYYALPPGCSPYYLNSINYYHCGSVYYQQTWSGNDIVYVVVNP
jgi:hypothetical protein